MEHFDWRCDAEIETPHKLFHQLNAEFRFTLDAAASDANAKCQKFFSRRENGLVQPWKGERVFVHPPADATLRQWIAKCYKDVYLIRVIECAVLLMPVRTDLQAWGLFVMRSAEVRFLEGRPLAAQGSVFPRCVVIFDRSAAGNVADRATKFSSLRLAT